MVQRTRTPMISSPPESVNPTRVRCQRRWSCRNERDDSACSLQLVSGYTFLKTRKPKHIDDNMESSEYAPETTSTASVGKSSNRNETRSRCLSHRPVYACASLTRAIIIIPHCLTVSLILFSFCSDLRIRFQRVDNGISEKSRISCSLCGRTEIWTQLTFFPRCKEQRFRRKNDMVAL